MTLLPSSARRRLPPVPVAAAVVVAWLAAAATLAAAGLAPPPLGLPPTILALAAAATAAGLLVPVLRRATDAAGVRGLTLLHAWRVPAGVAFLVAGHGGVLPDRFANAAGWGDVAVGLLALAFLPQVWRAPPRWAYALFHALGLGDLVLAVGTGAALTRADGGAMGPILELPLALIPLVGVPLSAAAHVLALARLRGGRR